MNDRIFNSFGMSSYTSPRLREELSRRFNSFLGTIQQGMSEVRNTFVDIGRNIYEYVNNDDRIEEAKIISMHADTIINPYTIYPIDYDTDFSKINAKTKRFIMACPELYELYRKGLIDGFEDILSIDKNEDPYTRIDYLRATEGFIEDGVATFTSYSEIDFEELTFTEKITIQRNWDVIKEIMKDGIDPTEI